MNFGQALLHAESTTQERVAKSDVCNVIKAAVCVRFQLNSKDLTGPSRIRVHCWPRFIAMSLIKENTRLSLPQIGRLFGGRDHTTVLNALERARFLRMHDDVFAEDYRAVQELVDLRVKAHFIRGGSVRPVFRSVRAGAGNEVVRP